MFVYFSKSYEFQNCSLYFPNFNMKNRKVNDYVIACSPRESFHYDVSIINSQSSIYFLEYSEYPQIISGFYIKEEYERTKKMPTLYIFDQAHVRFSELKYYNGQVNIIGSPTITSDYFLKIKEVNMYNSSLKLPFLYDEITYSDNKSIFVTYECYSNLTIQLYDNYSLAKCSDFDYPVYLTYPNLIKHLEFSISQYNAYFDIYNVSFINESILELAKNILSNTIFDQKLKVEYIKFHELDPDLIVNSTKQINQDFKVILRDDDFCHIYTNGFKIINNAIKKGWRKICYDEKGYIFYHGNSDGEIIVIPSNKKIAIIGFIVVLVIVMAMTFHCIAFCRYKIENRVDSSDELGDFEEEDI